jgi:hypothetical protein
MEIRPHRIKKRKKTKQIKVGNCFGRRELRNKCSINDEYTNY